MRNNYQKIYENHFKLFFEEDELAKNFNYLNSLPADIVKCSLKFKDDLVIAGLPFFFETFNYLLEESIDYEKYLVNEGKNVKKDLNFELHFELPFNVALSAERIALNLLQRSCSVATYTSKFVEKAGIIKILDTRKTTPGMRFLEKYAVVTAGGYNHRFSQTDAFMIKDNHKYFFGGLTQAIEHFKKLRMVYANLIVEIHSLEELKEAQELGIHYFLLDNFSNSHLKKAIENKREHDHFEISGGVTLSNLDDYLLRGVDAISSGSIIYSAPQVDISLKYHR